MMVVRITVQGSDPHYESRVTVVSVRLNSVSIIKITRAPPSSSSIWQAALAAQHPQQHHISYYLYAHRPWWTAGCPWRPFAGASSTPLCSAPPGRPPGSPPDTSAARLEQIMRVNLINQDFFMENIHLRVRNFLRSSCFLGQFIDTKVLKNFRKVRIVNWQKAEIL